MMFRRRIAAVSYLNTVPFLYGIERAANLRADLLLSPPSGCATAFGDGRADIALIPAGALLSLDNANIITDFCIGAHGPVRTVVLMSNEPLENIRRIRLDSHSITSAILVKILCAEYWGITPEFVQLEDYGVLDAPAPGEGFLLIGDKVFASEGKFANTRDLAAEWQTWTGLPFVFAVWVAGQAAGKEDISQLDKALRYGTEHIREAIDTYGYGDRTYAYDYLTRNIDFVFDRQKRRALELYWDKGRKFIPTVEPG